jgi:hypothetical protein
MHSFAAWLSADPKNLSRIALPAGVVGHGSASRSLRSSRSGGSSQLHFAQQRSKARIVPERIEMAVAQDRHHVLVALFDRAIKPLESGVEFPKAEVDMAEARWQIVMFRLVKPL